MFSREFILCGFLSNCIKKLLPTLSRNLSYFPSCTAPTSGISGFKMLCQYQSLEQVASSSYFKYVLRYLYICFYENINKYKLTWKTITGTAFLSLGIEKSIKFTSVCYYGRCKTICCSQLADDECLWMESYDSEFCFADGITGVIRDLKEDGNLSGRH